MDKIFSPIKQRLLNYLINKGISKESFYRATGIAAANFKGKGAVSELGGEKIAKILSIYKDLNPEWLIIGEGRMIKEAQEIQYKAHREDSLMIFEEQGHSYSKQDISELLKENQQLKEEIKLLKAQKEALFKAFREFGTGSADGSDTSKIA